MTESLGAHVLYRKIRDNSYAFPEDHTLSSEAVDLIAWILRPTPTDRPMLSEILAHPWFVTGPFPSRISTRALDPERAVGLCDEWSRMSKRHAWENFRKVKRAAGVVEVEGTGVGPAAGEARTTTRPSPQDQQQHAAPEMVSQALPIVADAVEEDPAASAAAAAAPVRSGATSSAGSGGLTRTKSTMRVVRAEEEKDAKGRVEKEVRAATAPESPISELLRCEGGSLAHLRSWRPGPRRPLSYHTDLKLFDVPSQVRPQAFARLARSARRRQVAGFVQADQQRRRVSTAASSGCRDQWVVFRRLRIGLTFRSGFDRGRSADIVCRASARPTRYRRRASADDEWRAQQECSRCNGSGRRSRSAQVEQRRRRSEHTATAASPYYRDRRRRRPKSRAICGAQNNCASFPLAV